MKTRMNTFTPTGRFLSKVANQANSMGISPHVILNAEGSKRMAYSRGSDKNSDGKLFFIVGKSIVGEEDVAS